jgi:hypothetical protein
VSVVFDPAPPRRSGGGPGLWVVPLLGVLVAIAVVKPWASSAPDPERPPTPGPLPSAPTASPSRGVPPWVDPRLPRVRAIGRVLTDRHTWGVRAIVDAGPTGSLVELWEPAAPPLPGGIASLGARSSDAVVFAVERGQVRLLGLTFPRGERPTEVRVAVPRPLGGTSRVTVRQVAVTRDWGLVFLMAPADRTAWPPGLYDVRVELADAVTSISVLIRGGAAS